MFGWQEDRCWCLLIDNKHVIYYGKSLEKMVYFFVFFVVGCYCDSFLFVS